jgi:hypothetical protein
LIYWEVKMREASRWIIGNAARFAGLWFVALTTGALIVIEVPSRFHAPRSIVGLLSLPLALCLLLFVAGFAAFVALVFFTPVLALWLALYLAVIFGLARALPSERSIRLAAIIAAPLLWFPLVHSGDHLVDDVSLAVACLWGLLVRPWPTSRSASQTPARGQAA